MRATLQFLRPCLRSRCRPRCGLLRVHHVTGIQQRQNHVDSFESGTSQEQLSELNGSSKEDYPRILVSKSSVSCQDFVNKYDHLKKGETVDGNYLTIRGMFLCLKPPDLGLCF